MSGGSGHKLISVLATVSFSKAYMLNGVVVKIRWTIIDAYPGRFYTASSNGRIG